MVFGTKKIAFIGGDARMIFAARRFAVAGFDVSLCGFELARAECGDIMAENASAALDGADFAVLPPVVSRDGENVHAPLAREKIPLRGLDFGGASVFAGAFCPEIKADAVNYAESEAFAVRNAVPTAEGALKIAMEETRESICGMRACVLGFGRIGAVLAKDLFAFLRAEARRERLRKHSGRAHADLTLWMLKSAHMTAFSIPCRIE